MSNILLTGSNGFLGAHILRDLLLNTNFNIYCIIRGKTFNDAKNKFDSTINYYFSDKEYFENFNNVKFIYGDIGKENFGLNMEEYNELVNTIDIVINSAGLTKHYGIYEEFHSANVKTVENIIRFCSDYKIKYLYHVSTMSVSGQFLCEPLINNEIIFDENCLSINQQLDKNVYIKTKYIAEEKINEFILSGGMATILRVGNLTCRFEDGRAQLDVENNAFTNRFKAFYNIGYIFEELKKLEIEFSPVDKVSYAIMLIVKNNIYEKVVHLYNDNFMLLEKVLYKVNIYSKQEFGTKLKKDIISNPNIQKYLPYIINDLSQGNSYKTNIKNDNKNSNELLKKIGFKWPEINEKYIEFFIKTFC